MSELITHTAIYEDCVRLALISPRVCRAFKATLEKHGDIASMGCLTRGGDKFPVQLLDYCRERWESRREGDFVEEKLAFTLGWRCHNAADRHFKPIYRKVQPEYYKNEVGADADEKNASDARIYHDLIVYREVYDSGRRKGFSPYILQDSLTGHPAAASVAAVPTEAAMGAVVQRSLWWNDQRDLRVALAAAYASPDRAKMREFAAGFYNPADPLIQLARGFQFARLTPSDALPRALDHAAQGSGYARALADTAEALRNAPQPLP